MKSFPNDSDSYHRASGLHRQWYKHNLCPSIRKGFGLGVIMSLSLIPFDFIFFGPLMAHYLPFRITSSSAFAIIYFYLKIKEDYWSDKPPVAWLTAIVLIGAALFNLPYIGFFEEASVDQSIIIEAAFFMNIFAFHLLLYQLWIQHYAVIFFFTATFATAGILYPHHLGQYQSWLLWNGLIGFFFWFQRRLFAKALYGRFKALLYQYSPRVARTLVTTGETEKDLMERFKPLRRPCICLCIDWRSFQDFATANTPEKVASLIEKSHETILNMVFKHLTNETFHADWSADEFFLVIYSERDDWNELLNAGVQLVQDIQATFHTTMKAASSDFVPSIDVGAASGLSVVGLLGPRTMKKMTALGKVGGLAKRYETEAKSIRAQFQHAPSEVVVVMDDLLLSHAKSYSSTWAATFQKRDAITKNISGIGIYYSSGQMIQKKAS